MPQWIPKTSVTKGKVTQVASERFTDVYGDPKSIKTPLSTGAAKAERILMMYTITPQLQRAIKYCVSHFQTVPYIFRRATNQQNAYERVYDSQKERILKWVNRDLVTVEFLGQLSFWFELLGAFYVAIEPIKGADKTESDLGLYVLLPQFVTPAPDKDGIAYYAYTLPGMDTIYFPADSIIEHKGNSPYDAILNHIDLGSVTIDADIYHLLRKGLKNNNANAAMFSGVLSTDQELVTDQREEIRRQVRERSMSPTDSYRLLILSGGMKFTQMMMQGEDKYADQLAKFVSKDIYTAVGVPERLADGQGDGKELEQLQYVFLHSKIKPIWDIFAQKFNKRLNRYLKSNGESEIELVPDYTQIPIFQKYALDSTRETIASLFSGTKTVNEIRENQGRPKFDGEYEEFANSPFPYWKSKFGVGDRTDVTPSLDVEGSQGGRDQSGEGEAELVDPSGKKSNRSDFLDNLENFLQKFAFE